MKLIWSLAAGPSNRDQTETRGVCKEGKSTQDQGTSFPSKVWRAALEQGFHAVSFVNDSFNRFTVCSQIRLHSKCLDSSACVSVPEGQSPSPKTRDAL